MAYQPRYQAFVDLHGEDHKNYWFMFWIERNLSLFAKMQGGTNTIMNPFQLSDQGHEDFTKFLQEKAEKLPELS